MRLRIQHMLYFWNVRGKTTNQIFKDINPVAKRAKQNTFPSFLTLSLLESLKLGRCPFLSVSSPVC